MNEQRPTDVWRQPAVTAYVVVCLAALAVIYFVLEANGLSSNTCLVPVLAGLVGIPFCWSKGPFILVVVLGVCVSVHDNRLLLSRHRSGLNLTDLTLAAALLAYVLGHFRLQGLIKGVMPVAEMRGDRTTIFSVLAALFGTVTKWVRRNGERRTEDGERRMAAERAAGRPQRLATSVSTREIAEFLLWLPFWAAGALVVSNLLPRNLGNPARVNVDPAAWYPLWRFVSLIWIVSVVLFVVGGVIDYWSRRRMRVDEAKMYLQDQFWRETHNEQRLANRWLAWARLGRPLGILDRLADFATTIVLLGYAAMLAWVVVKVYQSMTGA